MKLCRIDTITVHFLLTTHLLFLCCPATIFFQFISRKTMTRSFIVKLVESTTLHFIVRVSYHIQLKMMVMMTISLRDMLFNVTKYKGKHYNNHNVEEIVYFFQIAAAVADIGSSTGVFYSDGRSDRSQLRQDQRGLASLLYSLL